MHLIGEPCRKEQKLDAMARNRNDGEVRTVVEGTQSSNDPYNNTPSVHQPITIVHCLRRGVQSQNLAQKDRNDDLLYPRTLKIPGTRCSGVPQNVLVKPDSFVFKLHSPQLQRATWPVK